MPEETLRQLQELLEASDKKTFANEESEQLKKLLMKILINKDGAYGPYRHPKYAERLSKFIIRIMPLKPAHPKDFHIPTAAISFDEGIIYINRGFLVKGPDGKIDKTYLEQLNVLIRHELAHNLLMHQVRMMKKLGDKRFKRMSMSHLLHNLLNIIMDFEISNRKYTEDDKNIVKNMMLNGKLIGGLVTEMHREDWLHMTVEEMFEELTKELKAVHESIRYYHESGYHYSSISRKLSEKDRLTTEGFAVLSQYTNIDKPSFIWLPIEEYFKKSKVFKENFSEGWQEVIIFVYEKLKSISESNLKNMLQKIADSEPFEEVDLAEFGVRDASEDSLETVYTPEEKYIVTNVIKALIGNAPERPKTTVKKAEHSEEYKKGYNAIIAKLGKKGACTLEDIIAICAKLGISLDDIM